jgi:dTMP kinase
MSKKRGKFIVIEGVDGAGKSTCLDYLKDKLSREPIVWTREPGGTPIGMNIRELLLHRESVKLDPLAELLLFVADRAQHLTEVVRPNLLTGHHVISDRFAASSYAYQLVANRRLEWQDIFSRLHNLLNLKPDFYLILDLDPRLSIERIKGRSATATRFDQKALAYHQAVRRGFKQFVKRLPHHIIDASQTIEKVQAEALTAVAQALHLC